MLLDSTPRNLPPNTHPQHYDPLVDEGFLRSKISPIISCLRRLKIDAGTASFLHIEPAQRSQTPNAQVLNPSRAQYSGMTGMGTTRDRRGGAPSRSTRARPNALPTRQPPRGAAFIDATSTAGYVHRPKRWPKHKPQPRRDFRRPAAWPNSTQAAGADLPRSCPKKNDRKTVVTACHVEANGTGHRKQVRESPRLVRETILTPKGLVFRHVSWPSQHAMHPSTLAHFSSEHTSEERKLAGNAPAVGSNAPIPPSSIRLHPAAFILPPSSCRLHPAALILPPSSCRLHPAAFILPPSSCRPHPAALILPPSSCRPHPAALILPPSSCRPHPAALILPPSSCRPHPAALILPPSSCRPHPAALILPPSSCRPHPAALILPPSSCRPHPAALILPPSSCPLPAGEGTNSVAKKRPGPDRLPSRAPTRAQDRAKCGGE